MCPREWNREWRNSYCLSSSIVFVLELLNLSDPVELNVTLPWVLGIFQSLTLTTTEPPSLSPVRTWSLVSDCRRRPETRCVVCVSACTCVYMGHHWICMMLIVLWLLRVFWWYFTTLDFKDWGIFQPNSKTIKKMSSHHAVSTASYCLW